MREVRSAAVRDYVDGFARSTPDRNWLRWAAPKFESVTEELRWAIEHDAITEPLRADLVAILLGV